jgi:pilus assembly protein CpaB
VNEDTHTQLTHAARGLREMDAKKIALLLGALLIAGITAFMAKNMFAGASAPKAIAAAIPVQAPQGPEILVATRALPVGTIISADSFRYQPWPKELVENVYYLKGEADPVALSGTVVRTPITAGQPLTKGALVKPGDRGFLAAALSPGMRAVTVSVSEISGVAGFVFPGDRVDLMLTQSVTGDGPTLRATETIMRNLRVLATDRRTQPENPQGQLIAQRFKMVTIEATPRLAEKIVVAQGLGTLSLALRSIADNTAELEQAIASGDVKVPAGGDSAAEQRLLSAMSTRPSDRGSTLATGGDVSRFQRRSMPRQTVGKAPVAPQVPTVRISRGSSVEQVTLGGK